MKDSDHNATVTLLVRIENYEVKFLCEFRCFVKSCVKVIHLVFVYRDTLVSPIMGDDTITGRGLMEMIPPEACLNKPEAIDR